MSVVRIATRQSPLATVQAHAVAAALAAAGGQAELVPVTTEGDLDRTTPISQLAGRGVFVAGVQQAVLDGRADVAVHSAKDMRSTPTAGLTLVGVLPRGDVRDALVTAAGAERLSTASLGCLPEGALVATGSARRRAQLAHLRPDLRFCDVRGNIATRLRVVEASGSDATVDAVVVAHVALQRLDLAHRVTELLPADLVVPQAGQGAIAVEARTDDTATIALLNQVINLASTRCVEAERAVLAAFGGGCDLPLGAHATLANSVDGSERGQTTTDEMAATAPSDGTLTITAVVGTEALGEVVAQHHPPTVHRTTATGDQPALLGQHVAAQLQAALAAQS